MYLYAALALDAGRAAARFSPPPAPATRRCSREVDSLLRVPVEAPTGSWRSAGAAGGGRTAFRISRRRVTGRQLGRLPGPFAARRGRHGRGLSRPRYDARPRRRAQSLAGGCSWQTPTALARVRARSAHAGHAESSAHRRDLRPRGTRRHRRCSCSRLVEGSTLADRIALGALALAGSAVHRAADRRTRSKRRTRRGSSTAISSRPTSRSRPTASSRCSTSAWRRRSER